jgi:hypothetical protein
MHSRSALQHDEVLINIAWRVTRNELQEVCEELVNAGSQLLHVPSACVASQNPIEFNTRLATSLIILYDYSRPTEIYISLILKDDDSNGHIGVLLQRHVDVSDISWDDLAHCLFNVIEKIRRGLRVSFHDDLKVNLGQHTTLNLSGICVFNPESNDWQGQFVVRDGFVHGLVESVIPSQFKTAILKRGSLRRLVLQSYYADD